MHSVGTSAYVGRVAGVRFQIDPYDFASARRLSAELGLSHTVAQILVRRGLGDVTAARAFLEEEVRHPLDAFAGLRPAAERILDHVRRRSRITVHGDYDADGVCSTAILVRVLRTLRADVDWFLPSRFEDGYGLAASTIRRLAERGTRLLITADCAITAVDEVAEALAAGIDVVVTDHHAPRADGRLPDVPIVHPGLGANPCPDLCATGVAHKLAAALLDAAGLDPSLADEDLDLVALATVADVVPLQDENRTLVRAGVRALRRTRKPGLLALMAVARVDPSAVDAGSIGFRLAPRINAAGRLARADAGLELLLTGDPERARAVAEELDRCNAERRDVETRILFEAEAQVAHTPGAPAYVLASDGWHPGVVGIVAARLAERHHRPTVLIALDGGTGTGSGRSIPAFDLLAGLEAGASCLLRHGGHRAAAGLTIERERVAEFREAFVAHAASVLAPADLVPRERIDAVVPGDALGMGLCEELERLAPFGAGNPAVSLLIPCASVGDARPLGDTGRHAAFTLTAGGARAKAVRFGAGTSAPGGPEDPLDVAVRLEKNTFNGSTEPRLLIRHAQPCGPPPIVVAGEDDFAALVLRELERELQAPPGRLAPGERELRDVRGAGLAGVIADLVATGEPVLVLAAHAGRRARALAPRLGGFTLAPWAAFVDAPEMAAGHRHVVALDPPALAAAAELLERAPGAGWVHLAWGDPERQFALQVYEWEHALREPMAAIYRALRSQTTGDRDIADVLRGDAARPYTPWLAGRAVRVLEELGLAQLDRATLELQLAAAPGRTSLERSAAYRAYRQRLEEGRRHLSGQVRAVA